MREGTDGLERASPFRFIAESGIDATKKHHGLLEHVDLHTWVGKAIHRSTDRVQSGLQNGLAFLATVGSTAPFVGLFGTVWGIYHALTAIGVAGQARGISGKVTAQVRISDGAVKEVAILSGPRVYHAAVRAALQRYKCASGDGDVLAVQEFNLKVE